MTSRFRSLFGQSDQAQVRHQEVRALVLDKMRKTFEDIASHDATWIEPDMQGILGVICEEMHVSQEGFHEDKFVPLFFEPLGTSNIPPLDLSDLQTKDILKRITRMWDKPPPWPPTVTDQLQKLVYAIENTFCVSSRVYDKEYGWSNTLSHYAKWVECGDITPELVAEEFDRPVWGPRGSMPYLGYRARNQLNMPHTLLATLTRSEANEKLSRSEALTILTVMLTRLKSGDFPNRTVIPIMLISVFAGFQVRVLEAHYDIRGLVIRKSKFLSFANRDAAIPNMDILMSFMCSEMIGNTRDLRILTKVDPQRPLQ
ncbi:hypothetical protein BO83DRAFT_376451 [Aspergillus eucalypticola CBS 122712]|uniref:Uncharacterized protein n=1 Tax=Aspergillus eucalypticola (strain CBS 122712 / IBT 29274) TaxID=1448314 RepID=A0A317W173_ASPEC|nr:uncharacterized protein BO83DRAFT_376451 [Aspergillus eucalypticola CBS 122712]PWY78918.1 hypothetical protein BO83DRAFT_376451 [Aspergillus eucalypticola CBS 122712]